MVPYDQNQWDRYPAHQVIGPRELMAIAWRRKWYLALCLTVSFALGAVYYVRAERLYEVEARLLVEKLGSPLATRSEREDKDFLATHAEIIASPAVVTRAAERVDFQVPAGSQASPVEVMLRRLSVNPVMGTNVLSLSFQSDDAHESVRVVEAIIASYRDYLSEAAHDSSLEAFQQLTATEQSLRKRIRELEREYQTLLQQSPLVGSGQSSHDVQLARIDLIEQELAQVRSRRIQLETQLDLLANRSRVDAFAQAGGPAVFAVHSTAAQSPEQLAQRPLDMAQFLDFLQLAPQLSKSPVLDIAMIQEQLVQAQLKEMELSERYGDKWPEMRSVRAQISSLSNSLREALQQAPVLLRRELETVQGTEEELQRLYETEIQKTNAITEHVFKEESLKAELASLRTNHSTISSQLQQWKPSDEAGLEGPSRIRVGVLQAPTTPIEPIWPSPLVLFGACAAVGLATGGGLVTFLEHRRANTARRPPITPLGSQPLASSLSSE